MRPFNLDEYLANPSRKVVTRDGRSVRIICTDRDKENYPVIALFRDVDRGGISYEANTCYTRDGRHSRYSEDDLDLFFADDLLPDFKPYDRVLTRREPDATWKANLFSHFMKQGDNTIAVCLKGNYLLSDIIPFDENKIGKIE